MSRRRTKAWRGVQKGAALYRHHHKRKIPGAFWDDWVWTQDEGHPQRDLAEPAWRRRRWRKTNPAKLASLATASARLTKLFIGGLFKRVVL